MSYNSSKGPRNIGDLINEDDPDTLIDWESDKIIFKTNSTKRFTIDNNEISGSGAAIIMGATVLGNNLKVSGSTTLGDAGADAITAVGQMTASAGIVITGDTLVVANGIPTNLKGNVTLGNAASDVVILTGQLTGSAPVKLTNTLEVDGNVTLGNASGDTVTINAATVNIPNVAAGTDNTVVVYNGSTLLIDEIDSKVWTGALVDYTGTPVANQVATWSDVDTVGGATTLTFGSSVLNLSGNLDVRNTEPRIMFSSSAGSGLAHIGINSSNNVVIQNDTANKHIVFKANDNGTIREGLRLNGAVPEVVVNEGSDSLVNFRVESDSNTHMLYVTGSGKVGIGTSTPSHTLSVAGDISGSAGITLGGSIGVTGSITAGTSFILGAYTLDATDIAKLDAITNGTVTANKAVVVDASKNIATLGTVGCGAITSTGDSTYGTLAGGTLSGSDVVFTGNAVVGGTLKVTGSVLMAGNLGIGAAPTLPLDVQSTSANMARLANTANDQYGALLRLQNTRGGVANAGVADDFCGGIVFKAQDSTAAATQYGKISTTISSPTNTSEAGSMLFEVTTGGTAATEYLRLNGGATAITASVDVHIQGGTHHSGSLYRRKELKSTDYTLVLGDNIIVMDTTAAVLTASLPAVGTVDGIVYTIKNGGGNDMVIAPNGSEVIDGGGALTGSLGKAWTLFADYDVWLILSSHQG
jgi:hypothetical protein